MKALSVRILAFDPEERRFRRTISVFDRDSEEELPSDDASSHGVTPPESWWADYKQWNDFAEGREGHPVFRSIAELHEFNKMGESLVARLRDELHDRPHIAVEEFQPVYSNVTVGDVISAWWHIKDMVRLFRCVCRVLGRGCTHGERCLRLRRQNYGFVVPVQQLPVSDELKSRLMAWRWKKGKNWNDPDIRRGLNDEAHEIEEHILWELNVEELSEADRAALSRHDRKPVLTAMVSAESVF